MKPILLSLALLALFGFGLTASESPNMDLGVLRIVICNWETRGEAKPDEYVGHDGEVGYCAVRISTARLLGFKGTGKDLMNRQTNMRYAMKWIKRCYGRGNRTIAKLARCYNGPLAPAGYIRQIRSDYADAYKHKHGPAIKLAMM